MSSSIDTFSQVAAISGAVFWSIQLAPQIWLNYRRGHTVGLHQGMMILWACAGLPLGIHNILSHQHVALQIQAQILTFFSLVTWSQVLYYTHKWPLQKCIVALLLLLTLFGSIELAATLSFLKGSQSGQAPKGFIEAMAILAALGLSGGVLRHYYDIVSERTVRGLSWGFVLLDAAGGLASLLSIVVLPSPDRLSIGIYASELSLWIGILLAGLVFNVLQLEKRGRMPHTVSEASHGRQEDDDDDAAAIETHLERESANVATVSAIPIRLSAFSMIRRPKPSHSRILHEAHNHMRHSTMNGQPHAAGD